MLRPSSTPSRPRPTSPECGPTPTRHQTASAVRADLEGHGRALGGASVVLADLVPVDNVPVGGDVLRAAVLVLKVVGVLPHVKAEDRDEARLGRAVHERVVLVGGGDDLDGAIARHGEPCPAGAEDAGRRGAELRLEVVVRAEGGVDLRREVARRRAAAVLAHGAPEEAVVVVAAAGVVELGRLGILHERDERRVRLARHRLVEVVNVRLVVEVVVKLHGGSVDVRLERVVGVG
mmetsp:Transcript_8816/g.20800  ORF Transcript_8816/g.20800 Transcript_8816/m.20800 type:complete len:234 (+) Transcript_8816:125-826(+)